MQTTKNNFNKKNIVSVCLLLFGAAILGAIIFVAVHFYILSFNNNTSSDALWHENNVIVHALGRVDDYKGLNCLEGFEQAYSGGCRVFETDFNLTSDGRLVMLHEWESEPLSYDEFMGQKLEGKYTPLAFEDIIELMEKYPDIYIVTDFKDDDAATTLGQLEQMNDILVSKNAQDLLDRFIIQFYYKEDLAKFKGVADFGDYIFTLYKTGFPDGEDSFEDIVSFCKKNNVKTIVMRQRLYRKNYAELAAKSGISIYVHTINSKFLCSKRIYDDVAGIYSDNLYESDYDELEQMDGRWFDKAEKIYTAEDNSLGEIEKALADGYDGIYADLAEDVTGLHTLLRDNPEFVYITDYSEEALAELISFDDVNERIVFMVSNDDDVMAVKAAPMYFGSIFKIPESESLDDATFEEYMLNTQYSGVELMAMDESMYQPSFDKIAENYDISALYFYGKGIKNLNL